MAKTSTTKLIIYGAVGYFAYTLGKEGALPAPLQRAYDTIFNSSGSGGVSGGAGCHNGSLPFQDFCSYSHDDSCMLHVVNSRADLCMANAPYLSGNWSCVTSADRIKNGWYWWNNMGPPEKIQYRGICAYAKALGYWN